MFGINFFSKSSININGVEIEGKQFTLKDNKIIVDGIEYKNSDEIMKNKVININVNGDVNNVENVSGNITVTGNVEKVNATNGDITVNGAVQDAKTLSGDIHAQSIKNARTLSGDISI